MDTCTKEGGNFPRRKRAKRMTALAKYQPDDLRDTLLDTAQRTLLPRCPKVVAKAAKVCLRTVKGWRSGEHGMSATAYIRLGVEIPELRAIALEYWGLPPDSARAMELERLIRRYVSANAEDYSPNAVVAAE